MSAPRVDERLDHGGVTFGGRPHQRGLPAPAFLRVDVGAVRRAAPSRHRALPVRAAVISTVSPSGSAVFGVGPGLQQQLDDRRRVAVDAGEPQRRHAVAIGGLDVGAGANQQLARCPDRRRSTAQCSAVVPSACGAFTSTRLLEQRANRGRVAALTASTSGARRRDGRAAQPADEQRARSQNHQTASRASRRVPRLHHQSRAAPDRRLVPLLSAKLSRCTPTLSSSVRWRFASGVGCSYLMCRAPLSRRSAPPATTIGRFV